MIKINLNYTVKSEKFRGKFRGGALHMITTS